jgi:hypothetical protein
MLRSLRVFCLQIKTKSSFLFRASIYTGSAKNMYTHFNRWYLCIVFEVELNFHYNMYYCLFSTDVATRMTVRSCDV